MVLKLETSNTSYYKNAKLNCVGLVKVDVTNPNTGDIYHTAFHVIDSRGKVDLSPNLGAAT